VERLFSGFLPFDGNFALRCLLKLEGSVFLLSGEGTLHFL
jgi:hypothetical protein